MSTSQESPLSLLVNGNMLGQWGWGVLSMGEEMGPLAPPHRSNVGAIKIKIQLRRLGGQAR